MMRAPPYVAFEHALGSVWGLSRVCPGGPEGPGHGKWLLWDF